MYCWLSAASAAALFGVSFGETALAQGFRAGLAARVGAGSACHPSLVTGENAEGIAGLKGVDAGSYWGSLAPAATPREVVNTLSGAMMKVLQISEVRQRLIGLGYEPIGSTPEQSRPTSAAKWKNGRRPSRKRTSVLNDRPASLRRIQIVRLDHIQRMTPIRTGYPSARIERAPVTGYGREIDRASTGSTARHRTCLPNARNEQRPAAFQ